MDARKAALFNEVLKKVDPDRGGRRRRPKWTSSRIVGGRREGIEFDEPAEEVAAAAEAGESEPPPARQERQPRAGQRK